MTPFPTLDAEAPTHRVHPLRLGTVDVPESAVHGGAGPEPYTVPLLALLVLTPSGRPVLVDNGFDADVIPRIPTGHTLEPDALERALAGHGFGIADVEVVVNTHLHADHAGMNKVFTNARIHVQAEEYAYAQDPPEGHGYAYRPRSAFHGIEPGRFDLASGHVELEPGLWLLHTPGHTPGHQAVAVHTRSGWLIFTGDACDDQAVWEGRATPGIVDDAPEFAASLAAMRSCGAEPIFPHDLAWSERHLRAAY